MNKKAALLTVFLVVVIDLMGFGLVLPLLPYYATRFGAGAVTIGLLYSIYSFAQLFFAPFWGGLSDRIGRRPVMLLSTAGAVAAYLIFAHAPSLAVLFLSRLLAGMMGGNIATAQAYVADVTESRDRVKGMGLIGAAFGLGFVAGPAMASLLIHERTQAWTLSLPWEGLSGLIQANRFALPGYFAAAMSALSFLLVWRVLPESLEKKKPAGVPSERSAGVASRVFWQRLAEQGRLSGNFLFFPLLACAFILSFSQANLYSAFPLFCKDILNFSPARVGNFFVYMGLIAIVMQGGVLRLLAGKIREENLFFTGNLLMAAGMALIPLASTERELLLFLGIMAVGGSLNIPSLTSLLSKAAPHGKIGTALGTSQGLSALGRALGPAWGGLLYQISYPTPYFLTAAVMGVAILIAWKLSQAPKKP